MSQPFPALQRRHDAFLASVEECTLQDLLDHLDVVCGELHAGETGYSTDRRLRCVNDFLATLPPDADPVEQVVADIEAVEALITEHGDRRLK